VLDGPETAALFDVESSAAYASGYLLFNRLGTLMAQPFDPTSRQITGDGIFLAENICWEGNRYASCTVSDTGVLLYAGRPCAGDHTVQIFGASQVRRCSRCPHWRRFAVVRMTYRRTGSGSSSTFPQNNPTQRP
jgi:hypothetical protein